MKRYFAKPAPDDPMGSSNVYDRSQPDGTTSTGFRCAEVAVSLEEADALVRRGGDLEVEEEARARQVMRSLPR